MEDNFFTAKTLCVHLNKLCRKLPKKVQKIGVLSFVAKSWQMVFFKRANQQNKHLKYSGSKLYHSKINFLIYPQSCFY